MWWRALFIGIYGVIQTDGGDIVLMLPQAVYYDAEYETEKLPYITIDASRDGDAITRSFNLSNVTEKLEMGRKYVYELALYYTGDPLPKILPKDPSEITGDYWRAEKPDDSSSTSLARGYWIGIKELFEKIDDMNDANGTDRNITLNIDGYTEIPNDVFNFTRIDGNNQSLVIITSESVKVIRERAFRYCLGMSKAEFPNVDTVELAAFRGCIDLKKVDFPKVRYIGDYCFDTCTVLETVNIPKAEQIGNDAFEECVSLNTITLDVAKTIGSNVFNNCTSLTTVILPNVESMGQFVFNACTSLTNIEIGTGDNSNSTSLKVAGGLFNGVDLTNITLTVKAGVGTVVGKKWTIATTNTATGKKTFTFKNIIVVT